MIDKSLEMCDALAFFGATGTRRVGNIIDLNVIGRRLGAVNPITLVVSITTAAAPANTRLQFMIEQASAVNGNELAAASRTTLMQSPFYNGGDLRKNQYLIMPLISGSFIRQLRYLRMAVNVATAASTAGSMNAFLTMEPWDWVAHKAAPVRLV